MVDIAPELGMVCFVCCAEERLNACSADCTVLYRVELCLCCHQLGSLEDLTRIEERTFV